MKKINKVIAVIISVLLVGNILTLKTVQAYSDIKIISTTNITKEQAAAWAKSKGATDQFIKLADLYWKFSETNGKVNPAVAYVQSAVETGYGKFGGVIDATFNNPCGLKTTTGGDNQDPKAHQKFESWEQGVQAHLDHLALYAGAEGYPRTNTADPRHFPSIKGTAKGVSQLGGKWAPSLTYSDSILRLYWDLNQSANNLKPLMWIDSPSRGANIKATTVQITGWSINLSGVKKVDIYIDNQLQGTAKLGGSRPDIKSVYPEYPDAEISEFSYTLDTTSLSSGRKTLKVVSTGNDDTYITNEKTINIDRDKLTPKMWIDNPASGATIKGATSEINGWSINPSGVKKVEIYVDNQLKGTAQIGGSRPDINAVYPEYPGANTSGFSYTLDTISLSAGSKTLKVVSIGNDGTSTTNSKVIKIDKSDLIPITKIETPIDGNTIKGIKTQVSGWAINSSGVKEVQVYVNNELITKTTVGVSRPDINSLYPQYLNSGKSGFSYQLSLAKMTAGSKKIKIIAVGNDGTSNEQSTVINTTKPLIVVDPGHNQGGDYGASKTFNGVKYAETDLNMKTAIKLQSELVNRGYNVQLTRQAWEYLIDLTPTSLAKRTKLANDLKADAFISVHYNSNGSSSVTGIQTYYSTYKPGIKDVKADLIALTSGYDGYTDKKPTDAGIKSRTLAKNLEYALTSRCNYAVSGWDQNRNGYIDRNLFVTLNTNMPSVLVELGFLSNQNEAKRCADGNEQAAKAKVIADEVSKMF